MKGLIFTILIISGLTLTGQDTIRKAPHQINFYYGTLNGIDLGYTVSADMHFPIIGRLTLVPSFSYMESFPDNGKQYQLNTSANFIPQSDGNYYVTAVSTNSLEQLENYNFDHQNGALVTINDMTAVSFDLNLNFMLFKSEARHNLELEIGYGYRRALRQEINMGYDSTGNINSYVFINLVNVRYFGFSALAQYRYNMSEKVSLGIKMRWMQSHRMLINMGTTGVFVGIKL